MKKYCDFDEAIEILEEDSKNIVYIDESLKENEKFFLRALDIDSGLFAWASEKLRSNKGFIFKMIEKHGQNIFEHASASLKKDKKFIEEIVRKTQDASLLEFIDEDLKNDLELMQKTLSFDASNTLLFCGEEIKNNKEFFKEALECDSWGVSLEHMGMEIKSDSEIVKLAVKKDASELQYIPEEFFKDPNFIIELLTISNGEIFQYVPAMYRGVKDFCLRGVKLNGNNLQYIKGELKNDSDILSAAIKKSPEAIEYASSQLKSDEKTAEYVLQKNGSSLKYFDENIKNNLLFVGYALDNDSSAIEYVPQHLITKELLINLIKKSSWNNPMQYASFQLQNDPELIKLFQLVDDGEYEDSNDEEEGFDF